MLECIPSEILYYLIISIRESLRDRKKDSYTKKQILSFMWLWWFLKTVVSQPQLLIITIHLLKH